MDGPLSIQRELKTILVLSGLYYGGISARFEKKNLQLILSLILPLSNILHWFLWKVIMNFFSHICHSPFDHCKIDANDDKWNQHSKQSVEGHTLAGFFCKIDWLTITQIWVLGQIETIIMPKTISLISALPPKTWLNPKSARALFC